jgi:hypothetical protein
VRVKHEGDVEGEDEGESEGEGEQELGLRVGG